MSRVRLFLLVALLAAALPGCRTVRQTVFEQDDVTVQLVSQSNWGSTVRRGYDHPKIIAPVRIAHVLSRIDVRLEVDKGMDRVPAIETDALYTIADGVSKALADAGPDQHVAVQSMRRHKRFGVFDHAYLTSFVVYSKDDLVYVHLHHLDWEIPRHLRDRVPLPKIGESTGRFKVLASQGMAIVDDSSVAAAWRDPIFKDPTRTRITATGKVVRKTILMESPDPEAEQREGMPDVLPANLSPETLRRLANLEEERLAGNITESEYDLRRRAILRADPAF